MMNHSRQLMIAVYSAAHLLVDLACAFLMFRHLASTTEGYLALLLYNFCAFAMQLPLGILADRLDRNHLVAAGGCILIAAAYGLTALAPPAAIALPASVVLGLGNGMFHIGGGIDILNISVDKSAALGLFVSPGAFGVYFGTALGNGIGDPALPSALILLALAAAIALILIQRRQQGSSYQGNAEFSLQSPSARAAGLPSARAAGLPPARAAGLPPASAAGLPPAGRIGPLLAAASCLFIVVCLRSYVGLTLAFPWRQQGSWAVILVTAVVAGKALGGRLADSLGMLRTACLSLAAASLLFLLPDHPATGTLSVLLFNMTMPITLWAMARLFPDAKGFSFGLLTLALFIGYTPAYLGIHPPAGTPWPFALAGILSLALLAPSIALTMRIRPPESKHGQDGDNPRGQTP